MVCSTRARPPMPPPGPIADDAIPRKDGYAKAADAAVSAVCEDVPMSKGERLDRRASEVDRVVAIAGPTGRGGDDATVGQRTRTAVAARDAHVPKSLADRVHRCRRCGLEGDRDAVSAVLGAFVVLEEPGDPASAYVDYQAAEAARADIQRLLRPQCLGWQDTRSESTDLSAREGSCLAPRTSTPEEAPVARRTVGTAAGPTRDETGSCQTTPERTRWRTDLTHESPRLGDLWDSS